MAPQIVISLCLVSSVSKSEAAAAAEGVGECREMGGRTESRMPTVTASPQGSRRWMSTVPELPWRHAY